MESMTGRPSRLQRLPPAASFLTEDKSMVEMMPHEYIRF